MPLLANRVQETTSTTGTGTLALGGAVTGYVTFNSSFTNGDVVFYVIDDGLGNWEIGYGTVGTGTLTRDSVINSSNSNALVSFAAGTKRVFCSAPSLALLPNQTGNNGKYLTTDGTTPSWGTVATGTVTSVGLSLPAIFNVTNSPVTSSGTLTGSLATQTANYVWAGPTTGAAAAPTFRALVATDIPALSYAPVPTGTNTQLLANDGAGGFSNVTVGSGLSYAGGTLTATGSMVYPGAGIPNSTGSAWGTSYSVSGTGDVALTTSPTFVTPVLGTPTSGTLTNCTGLPIATGVSGLGAGVATFLATPSSANLAAAVSDETGSGALVFATSPTLTTPVLGTPTSGTLTNCTGLPISSGVSGLGANVATFLATPSSANLASAVSDETGSGALVFGTNPSLTTPTNTGLRETQTTPTISSGTLTLNCSVGNVFAVALNANITTLSFTNVPTSGTAYALTLSFTADGTARTVTWGASVKWPGGTAPTLTSTNAKVDTFVLTTWDGGTTWYAFIAGQNA